MEEVMLSRAHPLQETGRESRLLAMTLAVSFVGHLVIFAVFVAGPIHLPSRTRLPHVVNVSLVSMPSSAPAAGSSTQAAAKERKPTKRTPAPVSKPAAKKTAPVSPKETVSTAPRKWKPKTSLKKKTFKPARVVQSAIKRIEKTAEASKPDPLASAFERLRDQVAVSEKESKETPAAGQGASMPGVKGDGAVGRAGSGGVLTSEILLYQQALSYHIRNNWVFSEELAGNRSDLEVRLMIKIAAGGEIKDVWFEKRSGNRYLDESAYKAVMKSNPLPALPKGYQLYHIGLIFTPSGLQ